LVTDFISFFWVINTVMNINLKLNISEYRQNHWEFI